MLKKIFLLIFKTKNFIFRKVMLFLKIRPASYPYITGDGFRKIANHIYDETGKCKPEDIKNNQTVFLSAEYLDEYFQKIHPAIKYPYKLISHNSDKNIVAEHLKYIDNNIVKWYAQNVLTSHPKLVPIPCGFDNLYYYHNGIPKLFNLFSKKVLKKENRKNLILFGFSINTNPTERQKAYDFLSQSKISASLSWVNNPIDYLEALTNYKFVAAPDGNGHDDPRRWQAIYLKVIPIVKKSPAMEYFKNSGLPIWIIDDWNELSKYTERDLNDIYDRIIKKADYTLAFMDYWIKKINENENEN